MFHDILQQPTLIASTEKYQQLVYDSTTELVQPIQCILSALDRRSMALSKCASYESALRDANLMQRLSSTSTIGYIREAMIYSEQGKQRHVIRVCNRALSIVNTNDHGYDTLQRIKIHAQQRANRCVDFISHLPIDILTTTLIPMFMKAGDRLDACKPCPYLHVSHLWRDRIMQHIDGLDFVIQERNEMDTFPQLIEFAQHTKSLCVKKYSQGTWLGYLLRSNDFCSLQKLSVDVCRSVDVEHIVSSLKHISNTLTQLSLSLRLKDGPNLPLSTILMTCPNLTWLHMYAAHDVDLSSLPMTTWPNLTELYIKSTVNDITCDHIIGIWKRLPSLTTLCLHPCTDIQSTLIVTDYHPSMNYIGFDAIDSGIGFDVSDPGIALTFKRKGYPSDEIGVTHLALRYEGFEDNVMMVDVNPMLRKHANTLQDFILKDFDLEMDLDNSQDIQYPQLKKLYRNSSAWWIPRNAPMLQELTLTANTILEYPSVLDTIPANLKKLELQLNGGRRIVNQTRLAAYLDGLANQSQLKELVISSRVYNLGNMFDAICHLDQLERLNVRIYGPWTPNHMEIFFGKLVIGCPRLCSLNICCSAPSPRCINILKRLEHLAQLEFWCSDIDNDERFWHEIQTFTQLKRITIYEKKNANISSIRRLRKQRPDLQVMGTL
ncbi:hypothetical protein LRAMOSA11139 [Lichtheimia ramosa]|uniref:F-box domain-containing protein n=1 Tax=Lichtheimia ramosa TaxID=688394 RepID=A0A077WUF3_9FUNG|nr:hypothetical protein LRAMOSA11139 [Lichtheimia ramosa]